MLKVTSGLKKLRLLMQLLLNSKLQGSAGWFQPPLFLHVETARTKGESINDSALIERIVKCLPIYDCCSRK